MPHSKNQKNALIRLKTAEQAPSYTYPPAIQGEIFAGDLIDTSYGYSNPTWLPGFPAGTQQPTQVLLNNVSQGTSYLTTNADVGKTMQIRQVSNSAQFPSNVTTVSAAVTILAKQTFANQQGYLGGNVTGTIDYNRMQLYADAVGDSRGWCVPNTNTSYYQPSGVGTPNTTVTLGGTPAVGQTTSLNISVVAGQVSPLNGDSTDLGKIFLLRTVTSGTGSTFGNGGRVLVTGYTDTNNCTVQVLAVCSQTTFANSAGSTLWECSVMTLSFSAATGNGVTMTIGAPSAYYDGNALANTSYHGVGMAIGRIFRVTQLGSNNNIVSTLGVAVVTSVSSLGQATVNIISGSMPLSGTSALSWGVEIPLDSNGMPTIASQMVLSAYPATNSPGQLDNGKSYYLIWESPGASTNCTNMGSVGVTMHGPTTDGVSTTTMQFDVASSGNNVVSYFFDGPVTDISCPRDGTTTIPATGTFNPVCVGFYATALTRMRFMDFLNCNGSGQLRPDTDASMAPKDWKIMQRIYGKAYPSWQCLIRFAEAMYVYPGSKLKEIDYNIPPFASPAYATWISNLMTSYNPTGPVSLGLIVSWVNGANEPWNNSFITHNSYQYCAMAEAQVLSQYGGPFSPITSVTQSGTAQVTVVLNLTPAQLAAQFNGLVISVGTPLWTYDGSSNSTWNNINMAAPVTVTSVSSTSSSTTFTYNSVVNTTQTASISSTGTQFVLWFNTTSNLLNINNVAPHGWNVYNLSPIYYTRQVWLYKNAWTRSQDKFYLNTQYGGYYDNGQGYGSLGVKVEYTYGALLGSTQGGTLSTWLNGMSVAPYVTANLRCDTTNGSPTVTNLTDFTSGNASTYANAVAAGAVPIDPATVFVAGDQIQIGGTVYTVQSVTAGAGTGSITLTSNYNPTGTPGAVNTRVSATIDTVSPDSTTCDRWLTAAMANLNGPQGRQIKAHVYFCQLYGITPLAYEGGPDTQLACNLNPVLHVSTQMGTFVTALADKWFKNGGRQFNFYSFSLGAFTNGQQSGWPITTDYGNLTNPKYLAWVNYSTPRNYANEYGSPGSAQPLSTAWVACSASPTVVSSGAGAGNVTFSSYASSISMDTMHAVPRTRRFSVSIPCTGSVIGQTFSVYANPTLTGDGTLLGTITIPNNGAGASTAPAAATIAASLNIPSGSAVIRMRLPAGLQGAPGFGSIQLLPS